MIYEFCHKTRTLLVWLVLCSVEFHQVDSVCEFYPTNGVINHYYSRDDFRGHTVHPHGGSGSSGHQGSNSSSMVGTNIDNQIFGRSIWRKRNSNSIYENSCHYAGLHHNTRDGRLYILVDTKDHGQIWVDSSHGYCGNNDCCGIGHNTYMDHCSPNNCLNGGHCSFDTHGYFCHCAAGYIGIHCGRETNHCHPKPCAHGLCQNRLIGYTCLCHPGYTGTTCNKLSDHCNPNPCVHGACQNSPTGYTCTCHSGYTGKTCNKLIDRNTTPPHTAIFIPSFHDLQCGKVGLLTDLASGEIITNSVATGCSGQSSDAVLLKHCSAPSTSQWMKGKQITTNCSQIKKYTAIAQWMNNQLTDVAGVFLSCQNGMVEVVSQSCGGPLKVTNVTGSVADTLYTVTWI